MNMEIEDHEIHDYENTKSWNMESSKEIYETMNLKTRMSENPWAVWNLLGSHIWSTVSTLIFWNLKLTIHIVQILNLKTNFLVYGIVNLKIKLSRAYEKSTLMPMNSWIWKRHSHEIMNMKTNFLWNPEYENGNAMTSWIWNQNCCKDHEFKMASDEM